MKLTHAAVFTGVASAVSFVAGAFVMALAAGKTMADHAEDSDCDGFDWADDPFEPRQ